MYKTYQHNPDKLLKPLASIISKSHHEVILEIWKKVNVIPIFKKNKKSIMSMHCLMGDFLEAPPPYVLVGNQNFVTK